MFDAVVRNDDAVMNLALTVHPLAHARFAHEIGESLLEHTGADAAQHILARLAFQHDAVDALEVQKLAQEQPGRAAADDADFRFDGGHAFPPRICAIDARTLRRFEWTDPSETGTDRT